MNIFESNLIWFVAYILPILFVWIRVESRLSKMEARLDLLLTFIRRRQ